MRLRVSLGIAMLVGLAGFWALRPAVRAQPPSPEARLDPTRIALLLRFGSPDGQPATWEGQVSVEGGSLVALRGWRFQDDDAAEPSGRFSFRLRRANQPQVPPAQRALAENGLLVVVAGGPGTEVRVTTHRGEFAFAPARLLPGQPAQRALGGLVTISRVTPFERLTAGETEDDFPAVASARDGTLWVAYIAYTNGVPERSQINFRYETPPPDFQALAAPAGGDQLWVTQFRAGRWSAPVPLTEPRRDLYRCAIALDGAERPVVVWSENRNGEWDLYARTLDGDRWRPAVRVSANPGPDIHPAMATDAHGRVWLVWQSFVRGQSEIVAARYVAGRWSEPAVVGSGPANEWDPAIAADAAGNVAIAWDSYAKGDYDVALRILPAAGSIAPGEPTWVAASLDFEARPALAYDRAGRLWIAWEEMPARWGKDFGNLVRDEGRGLYQQGPQLRVRVRSGNEWLQPAESPGESWPNALRQANNFVRLATDGEGRMWLLFRHREPLSRGPIGTVWYTYATTCEGNRWSAPILLPNTDAISDSRPAIARGPGGSLLVVQGSDARQHRTGNEPYNYDLWVNLLRSEAPVVAPALVAAPPPGIATPESSTESEDVARIRAYRFRIAGRSYRLWRGEFHRHTEISPDGNGDGPLLDMFRYGLDAAQLDWIGNGDHDNGSGREYTWWITQKLTDVFHLPRRFTPMFTYERSVRYPDGHRNVMFAQRGIRTLPRLAGDQPNGVSPDDTKMLYRMLRQFDGICASHTSGTDMGTDWRDSDPLAEPIVEIYQGARRSYEGPGQPRVGTGPDDSPGGWQPAGWVWNALDRGIKLGFQASSDHGSTHISYAIALVEEPTRRGVLSAFQRRHCYGATDNIILDVRCGDRMMGDEFTLREAPYLLIRAIGTAPIARVDVIKNGAVVYSTQPNQPEARLLWKDPQPTSTANGRPSYYYVRVQQVDGEVAWGSPLWIHYRGE